MHRITPAYAGKRSPCNCNRKTAYNHPRLRGEKFYTRPCRASKRGSPPLTRGKESIGTAPFPSMRITPAYAGKRPSRAIWNARNRDHPRLRGEKRPLHPGLAVQAGSPPLTRGKASSVRFFSAAARITPAYAGKSENSFLVELTAWDHPRLRGEKEDLGAGDIASEGSPPLTRGKGDFVVRHFFALRITPAYAGKSRFRRSGSSGRRDHPRLRGEKKKSKQSAKKKKGSPPLTRGKDSKLDSGEVETGITPAYAGKSIQ